MFAVGVVTGTMLSFEFGLLWPDFTATFGEVFGLGFGLEGVSFFVEAIFIAIYVYGWDRMPPSSHFLTGIPVVGHRDRGLLQGDRGQRVDEQPRWVRRATTAGSPRCVPGRRCSTTTSRTSSCTCTWRATWSAGFIVAGIYARGLAARATATATTARASWYRSASPPGRAGPGDRGGLGGAPGSRVPAREARRHRGLTATTEGAAFTLGGILRHRDQ